MIKCKKKQVVIVNKVFSKNRPRRFKASKQTAFSCGVVSFQKNTKILQFIFSNFQGNIPFEKEAIFLKIKIKKVLKFSK